MTSSRPSAIFYVDGLNLYRQKLAFHPELKWLNLVSLFELMLPTHEIRLVRYFTSEVKPAMTDSFGLQRQRTYIRALRTLGPRVSIHFGTMRMTDRKYLALPLEQNDDGTPRVHKVRKTEEKGSDTSLAAHMVYDAACQPADIHVLVSSDSDFEPVLELLADKLGVATGLFSPIEKPSGSLLRRNPLITKIVRKQLLEISQFDEALVDSKGKFERPANWKKQNPLA